MTIVATAVAMDATPSWISSLVDAEAGDAAPATGQFIVGASRG